MQKDNKSQYARLNSTERVLNKRNVKFSNQGTAPNLNVSRKLEIEATPLGKKKPLKCGFDSHQVVCISIRSRITKMSWKHFSHGQASTCINNKTTSLYN